MRDVAILIDGGFFLKRIQSLGHLPEPSRVEDAMDCFRKVTQNHLRHLNRRYGLSQPPRRSGAPFQPLSNPHGQLYRIFFYDAPPYEGRAHHPISKTAIDFAATEQARFRRDLFAELRKTRDVALRLGELSNTKRWVLTERSQKDLLNGRRIWSDLKDENFRYDLAQKGVDMRIGLDIASLTLKKQVKIIVLVTGDSDFVPAAKLARREGVEIILDPLRYNISRTLFEHIDGLRHGLAKAGEPAESEEGDGVDEVPTATVLAGRSNPIQPSPAADDTQTEE